MTVAITPIQKRVYDRIVELTDTGKKTHQGQVSIPGVPGSTTNHYIVLFAMLGLLKLEMETRKKRKITLLVGPEGVETVSVGSIMHLRMGGRQLREDRRPRDDGKFSRAFEDAFGGRGYPSLRMKADLPFKGSARADARAL